MSNDKQPVIVSHIRALVSSIGRVLSKHVDNEAIELVDDKLTLKEGSIDASKLVMSNIYTAVYDALGIPAPSSDAFVLFGGGFDSCTTEFTGELSSSDIEATPTFCARRGNAVVARISDTAFWVIDLESKLNWAFVGSLPEWTMSGFEQNGPLPIHMFKSGVMAHVSQGDGGDVYADAITVQTVVPKNYGKVTI